MVEADADVPGGLRLRLVACGTLRPPAEAPPARRLRAIHDGLREVLRAHAPHAAAVEEAFAGLNVRSALRLGEARAVCLLAAEQAGLATHELSPSLVKRVVAGHGAAGKPTVKAGVLRLLGLPPDEPVAFDAADALAVAIAARTRLEVPPALGGDLPIGRRRRRGKRWTEADVRAHLPGEPGGAWLPAPHQDR